ncbi:hypothetical protein EAH89_29755 [Roseomonas nepalensis]|uniref:Uncharacterized protein n=1 Tax=Muricoccus nepalensis TaxID=1854500 RepID=A0A502EJN3_9PROT|nr:hypothetical protein EAH89_29755 [Roseomonas nepalensis]
MGLLDRVLPWTTAAQRDAEVARQMAQAAEDQVYSAQHDLVSERRRVETDGPMLAGQRAEEQAAWERTPEVREAKERQRLNEAALRMAQAGDPAVTAVLASGDPAAARAEVLRQEAEQRQREEQQRAQMALQAKATPGGPSASAPAPRMR